MNIEVHGCVFVLIMYVPGVNSVVIIIQHFLSQA